MPKTTTAIKHSTFLKQLKYCSVCTRSMNLRDCQIFVYPRPGYENTGLATHLSVIITMTPLIELSATFIRQSIAQKKNVQYFVPDAVLEFIDSKHLYR
jgi:nicotinate-nucleotide adenylyltransferase